jgi:cobalt/nickel transport system ATP-binding protein
LALASVLGLSPVVWLLDFINQQGRAGKTVITATHDLGILETIAERVYVLGEDHRVVAEGTPQQILADKVLLVFSCLTRP